MSKHPSLRPGQIFWMNGEIVYCTKTSSLVIKTIFGSSFVYLHYFNIYGVGGGKSLLNTLIINILK